MSQHCRANPCCGDRPCSGIPLPQDASGLPAHNKRVSFPSGSSNPMTIETELPAVIENERLRHIVSDCAAALVSGAFISPKASVEFMEGLPKEISLVVSGLRARCEKAEAEVAEAKASRDLQARIASDEEGLSLAAESRCAELDLRIAETRAAALEEAAKLATICIDPADRCKCSSPYEIAAAIRSLIPQKEG